MSQRPSVSTEGTEFAALKAQVEALARVVPAAGLTEQVSDISQRASDLAADIDTLRGQTSSPAGGFAARVGDLSASAANDTEVVFLANPSLGVEWRLKFATAESLYKWRFNGGSELYSNSAGAVGENLGSAWSRQVSASTPSITIPRAGDYMFSWGTRVYVHPNDYNAQFDVEIGDGTNFAFPVTVGMGLAGAGASGGTTIGLLGEAIGRVRFPNVSAGSTWRMWMSGSHVGSGNYTSYDRWISALPIRII